MADYEALYDLLLDYADLDIAIERVVVGLHWSVVDAGVSGIAATVAQSASSHQWQEPLAGRNINELASWLLRWDRQQASLGLAAANAAINREADMVYQQGALFKGRLAEQSAFDWFLPRLIGQQVAIVSERTDIFDGVTEQFELHRLNECRGAVPASAEQILPRSDWIFIDAATIADKSLPRLLTLCGDNRVVLFGPQTPWLEEWRDFGVDYLFGCQIDDHAQLFNTVAEGGSLQRLPQALSYRIIDLQTDATQEQLPTIPPPKVAMLRR